MITRSEKHLIISVKKKELRNKTYNILSVCKAASKATSITHSDDGRYLLYASQSINRDRGLEQPRQGISHARGHGPA
jgi:hypothetical protein